MRLRLLPALTVAAAILLPATASAQQERASPLPSYTLVQLSAKASQVAPADFEALSEAITSCSEAVRLANSQGWQAQRKRFVHQSELPPVLRPVVQDVPTGKATPVLSERGEALHVLVVCNR
ncbi:MAG: hypothetical protein RIC51_12650 [Erythrobacter sp.]|uniref:hypothetical protein n=1 Tax=Erythrobacter sp. TaxID=1042 RepID=UPI0032EB948C